MSTISSSPANVQRPDNLQAQESQEAQPAATNQGQLEEAAKGAATHAARPVEFRDEVIRDATLPASGAVGAAIPPPGLPPVNPAADEADGAAVLADNTEDALGPLLKNGDPDKWSADILTKLFMMLNILDPNNHFDTLNTLGEAQSLNRQQAIEAVQKQIENLKEQLKEAEKEAAMWGLVSNLLLLINPMGIVLKMAGNDENLGVLGGVLAPEQMLLQATHGGAADEKVADIKADLKGAEGRLKNVEFLVGQWPADRRKKLERENQEAVDKLKAETASAGEDGVPLKGLAAKLKGKLGDVLKALAAIGAEQGPAAMMQAAPALFNEAVLGVLTEADIKDAPQVAEQMAELLSLQLAMGVLSAPAATSMGPMTLALGSKLDGGGELSPDTTQGDPQALIKAYQESLTLLRQFADGHATGNRPTASLQG